MRTVNEIYEQLEKIFDLPKSIDVAKLVVFITNKEFFVNITQYTVGSEKVTRRFDLGKDINSTEFYRVYKQLDNVLDLPRAVSIEIVLIPWENPIINASMYLDIKNPEEEATEKFKLVEIEEDDNGNDPE